MSINAISSPDNRISRKKVTVKRLTICRCERPQFLNDPPLKKKKKRKTKEKKKRKIEMKPNPAPRAEVGWDRWLGWMWGEEGGGGGGRGERDNSERMKCKSGNKGNVAEN